jgi:hypothetical protein
MRIEDDAPTNQSTGRQTAAAVNRGADFVQHRDWGI